MRFAVLGSGSAGNCLVVESAGRTLVVDAGFSCRQIERRYRSLGRGPLAPDALLLTHEHVDHVRGADRLVRRHRIPVFATTGTLGGTRLGEEASAAARIVRSGVPFEAAGLWVEPFGVPHDAREPVGFTLENGTGLRLGVCFDLGSRSQLAWGRLRDVDALVLETNHDLQMLRDGPYPWHLKQRVASRHGHLSNQDAADGLTELVGERLRSVVLYHLSRTNNLPALAAQAVEERLAAAGSRAAVVVTAQDEPTSWVEVGAQRTLF